MSASESNKSKKTDDKLNPFDYTITLINQLPDPAIGCKFLPCGKSLLDFTEEPVSFPQLETQFKYQFKGLHLLFDIDLNNQNTYGHSTPLRQPLQLEAKDAALLADIDELHINNTKPKDLQSCTTRALECRELFANEQNVVPRSSTGVQRLPSEIEQLQMESLSLEQQKQLVQQTFVDIEKPLDCHPTKPGSNARPIDQLPIFPDANALQQDLVQVHFVIPPSGNSNIYLKDCGSYFVNFKLRPDPLLQHIQDAYGQHLSAYLSEQRYKEEHTPDSTDRGEDFMLLEKDGSLYYKMVNRQIILRKERQSLQAMANICLLIKRAQKNTENVDHRVEKY